MSVNTTPPTGWASKISDAVALVLLAASAVMNTQHGWSKGDTLATQCVWAAIAAGSRNHLHARMAGVQQSC